MGDETDSQRDVACPHHQGNKRQIANGTISYSKRTLHCLSERCFRCALHRATGPRTRQQNRLIYRPRILYILNHVASLLPLSPSTAQAQIGPDSQLSARRPHCGWWSRAGPSGWGRVKGPRPFHRHTLVWTEYAFRYQHIQSGFNHEAKKKIACKIFLWVIMHWNPLKFLYRKIKYSENLWNESPA